MSPSLGQAEKNAQMLKVCCSWIHSKYLVFLCGLSGLCGKTETFGLVLPSLSVVSWRLPSGCQDRPVSFKKVRPEVATKPAAPTAMS